MKVTRHEQGSSGRVVASGQKDLNTNTFPNSVLIGDSYWWLMSADTVSSNRFSAPKFLIGAPLLNNMR